MLAQGAPSSAGTFSTGEIPAALAASPLLRRGGFDVFQGMLNGELLRALLVEALASRAEALESDVPVDDGEEARGGNPARRFLSASGGRVQDAFYKALWMGRFLGELLGMRIAPTGERGTYSYYSRPGDFLALHRDVEACDVAVISCLHDGRPTGDGGSLRLYPDRIEEPLSAIRRSPERGAVGVRLLPGQTLVLLGGLVPHTVLPVVSGQARIVSVLCYRAVTASPPPGAPTRALTPGPSPAPSLPPSPGEGRKA
jgi:hypothetical protein